MTASRHEHIKSITPFYHHICFSLPDLHQFHLAMMPVKSAQDEDSGMRLPIITFPVRHVAVDSVA